MAEHRSLLNKIIFEIRKEKQKYYNKKIKPARCSNLKQSQKMIKNITGKCKQEFIISNPESEIPLTSKGTANE